jgi:hypothetical protein
VVAMLRGHREYNGPRTCIRHPKLHQICLQLGMKLCCDISNHTSRKSKLCQCFQPHPVYQSCANRDANVSDQTSRKSVVPMFPNTPLENQSCAMVSYHAIRKSGMVFYVHLPFPDVSLQLCALFPPKHFQVKYQQTIVKL